MAIAEITTPRLSQFDQDKRIEILRDALSRQDAFTSENVEDFISKLENMTSIYNNVCGVTSVDLQRAAENFPQGIKKMTRSFIRRRLSFPGYKETPGLFRYDFLVSAIRWYERKYSHRNLLLAYSGHLDIISAEDFHEYIRQEIVIHIPRLSSEFWKTAFTLICGEAAVMCCPSPQPNMISIKHLLASTILDEIDEAIVIAGEEHDNDPLKWFSVQNLYITLNHFRMVDEGGKGMLSFDDLFRLGHLNPVFLKGFWDSHLCYKFNREVEDSNTGEKSIVVETDLSGLVALERLLFNIGTLHDNAEKFTCPMEYTPILKYVFRCLSENWDNYWSITHFYYIVENLRNVLMEHDPSMEITVADMMNIFLLFINPKDSDYIHFSDVEALDKNLRPGSFSQSSLFLGMLIDAQKFRNYDNRESV